MRKRKILVLHGGMQLIAAQLSRINKSTNLYYESTPRGSAGESELKRIKD